MEYRSERGIIFGALPCPQSQMEVAGLNPAAARFLLTG